MNPKTTRLTQVLQTEEFLMESDDLIHVVIQDKGEITTIGTISKTAWYQSSDEARAIMINKIQFGYVDFGGE